MIKLAPIDSGGLMLTYKCNSSCRHCLYAAGPSWKDWMDVEDARRIFEGLLQTSPILRGFHLAGGEPFLDFQRLLRIQRMATEFGIPIEYAETNAGWCIDEDVARDNFEQLRDAGLSCILVSCSPFHAESIPLNRIMTAVKIGYEVFGPNGVILWVPEFYRQLSDISTERTVDFEEYVAAVGGNMAKHMVRSGYSLISGGRVGYQLGKYCHLQPPEHCQHDVCRLELIESGHAHFDPYGNMIPAFCSGISLGNSRYMLNLISEFDIDKLPIVRILAEEGPYALYKFAASEFDYKPASEGYVGKCHLCVDVRRHIREKTDEFPELTPLEFYQKLT